MNNLIKLLLAVVVLFFWNSCNDDIEFEINDTPLLFSKDTVYLDTVFLIGSISNSVQSEKQFSFLLGAISSSFLFFFFLGYMGFKIGPLIKSPNLWKKINISLGIIMIMISFNLIYIYL